MCLPFPPTRHVASLYFHLHLQLSRLLRPGTLPNSLLNPNIETRIRHFNLPTSMHSDDVAHFSRTLASKLQGFPKLQSKIPSLRTHYISFDIPQPLRERLPSELITQLQYRATVVKSLRVSPICNVCVKDDPTDTPSAPHHYEHTCRERYRLDGIHVH